MKSNRDTKSEFQAEKSWLQTVHQMKLEKIHRQAKYQKAHKRYKGMP